MVRFLTDNNDLVHVSIHQLYLFPAITSFGGTWLLCYILKLDDLLVLSLAAFSRVMSALVMIFATQVWHIYVAQVLSSTLSISGSIIRSFLSRIVAKDELGNRTGFYT